MSLFGSFPWKELLRYGPGVVDFLQHQRQEEVPDLKHRLAHLEASTEAMARWIKYLIASVVALFVIAITALVVSIDLILHR